MRDGWGTALIASSGNWATSAGRIVVILPPPPPLPGRSNGTILFTPGGTTGAGKPGGRTGAGILGGIS
jgi:hypothetical protein